MSTDEPDPDQILPTCQNGGGCMGETFAVVDDPVDRGWLEMCGRHTLQAAALSVRLSQAARDAVVRILEATDD